MWFHSTSQKSILKMTFNLDTVGITYESRRKRVYQDEIAIRKVGERRFFKRRYCERTRCETTRCERRPREEVLQGEMSEDVLPRYTVSQIT